jgi:hypothetical protein
MSRLTLEQRRERWSAGGRKGGATRAKSFTPEYQRRIRARASHESLSQRGRLGALGLAIKRKNRDAIIAAQWRAWETDRRQYCSHCKAFQAARQEDRAETCVFVCEVCGNPIELPF